MLVLITATSSISPTLQKANVTVIDNAVCRQVRSNHNIKKKCLSFNS